MRLLILFTLVTFIVSCNGEEVGRSTRSRTIKNLSSHIVDLEVKSINSYSYKIAIGDSVIIDGYCETGASDLCYVSWNEVSFVSGKVIFDNEKQIIYSTVSCDTMKNPFGRIREFDVCGYTERSNNGRVEVDYLYIIDDTDYEKAFPIEN